MKWNKYTIRTIEEAEDLISAMLAELGFDSVEIEDKRPISAGESGGLFGEVVPEMPEDDHIACVSFYTEEDVNREQTIKKVRDGLEELRHYAEIGDTEISESTTADEDWINNWKEYFHSFYVDDILIRPTWEADRTEAEHASLVLNIDPGTAFGTGAHESTQLAIRAIRKYIKPGDRFLDIGTGSGILGIVALKSGASHVFGTDLDENTLPAIADNLAENGIEGKDFERVLGNIADDPKIQEAAGYGCYEIAAANIIAEILADITPAVPEHLVSGGLYITSGILNEKEDLVRVAAEKAGFSLIEKNRQNGWSGMVFRKN